MAPGYVRHHHLITGSRVYRSRENGQLMASVTVATPPPAEFAKLCQWRDWPTKPRGGNYVPVGPYDAQIERAAPGGYALTIVEPAFALPSAAAALPALPGSPEAADLTHIAATAVGVLVGALNDIAGPVLDALQEIHTGSPDRGDEHSAGARDEPRPRRPRRARRQRRLRRHRLDAPQGPGFLKPPGLGRGTPLAIRPGRARGGLATAVGLRSYYFTLSASMIAEETCDEPH